MSVVDVVRAARVVPVIVLDKAEDAVPLARTFLEAEIGTIEITLRTKAGLEAIRRTVAEVPKIAVGAGTVTHARGTARGQEGGGELCGQPRLHADPAQGGQAAAGRRLSAWRGYAIGADGGRRVRAQMPQILPCRAFRRRRHAEGVELGVPQPRSSPLAASTSRTWSSISQCPPSRPSAAPGSRPPSWSPTATGRRSRAAAPRSWR